MDPIEIIAIREHVESGVYKGGWTYVISRLVFLDGSQRYRLEMKPVHDVSSIADDDGIIPGIDRTYLTLRGAKWALKRLLKVQK